jgi:hypothetical protein
MAGRRVGGWIVGFGLLACGGDDGGDGTLGETFDAPTTTEAATTGTPTSTTPGMASDPSAGSGSAAATDTGDDGAPGTDGAMTSDDADGPGSSGDVTGAETGAGDSAGVCEGPQANACLDCAVPACCEQWSACQADEGCACVIDCHVVQGGSLGSCESQCGSDGELYQGVFFCGQQSCLGACEWDCC